MAHTKALLLFICAYVQYSQAKDFYSYTVQDNTGQDVSLERYRGKVTLVVNVASLCGYTDSTYKELKKLHDILSYGDYFSVLAFPCNQFGDQEPHEIEDIVERITNYYDVEFPIFNKISVFGEYTDPAFKFLTESSSVVPDWNFYKYLVDESGQVIGSWGTRMAVQDIFDEIQAAVDKAKAAGKAGNTVKKSDEEEKVEDATSGTTKEEL